MRRERHPAFGIQRNWRGSMSMSVLEAGVWDEAVSEGD